MTLEDIDTALRHPSRDMGFTDSGRLLPNSAVGPDGRQMTHPTYCNRDFCASVASIAEAHGLTADEVADVVLDALESGEHAAWRALCSAASAA